MSQNLHKHFLIRQIFVAAQPNAVRVQSAGRNTGWESTFCFWKGLLRALQGPERSQNPLSGLDRLEKGRFFSLFSLLVFSCFFYFFLFLFFFFLFSINVFLSSLILTPIFQIRVSRTARFDWPSKVLSIGNVQSTAVGQLGQHRTACCWPTAFQCPLHLEVCLGFDPTDARQLLPCLVLNQDCWRSLHRSWCRASS